MERRSTRFFSPPLPLQRKLPLATPNYGYEKRQKELAKKRKKEEKLRAKAERRIDGPGDAPRMMDGPSAQDRAGIPTEPQAAPGAAPPVQP